MKRKTYLCFICMVCISIICAMLTGCGNSDSGNHEGEAKTPSASSSQKGRNYQDVMSDFKKKGFTNIKTEVIEDLIFGWLKKDGEVESVSVDGKKDYRANAWYPEDADVIIKYHTFLQKTESNEKTTKEPETTEDGAQKIYDAAVGKSAIDIYNKLKGLGYTVSFKHAVSEEDFTDIVLNSSDPTDSGSYIPWIITDVDSYSATSKTASFFINTQEMINEAKKQSATADALQAKLDVFVAWQTVKSYGKRLYPAGFKLHYMVGNLAETAKDKNTWFLKATCEYKNEYGTWMKNCVCEAHVSGITESPKVVDFIVY